MRILFMGTPEFAVEQLRRLVEKGHEICGVHPAGQAQESGHENDVFSCEGVCLDTGLGSLSAG